MKGVKVILHSNRTLNFYLILLLFLDFLARCYTYYPNHASNSILFIRSRPVIFTKSAEHSQARPSGCCKSRSEIYLRNLRIRRSGRPADAKIRKAGRTESPARHLTAA